MNICRRPGKQTNTSHAPRIVSVALAVVGGLLLCSSSVAWARHCPGGNIDDCRAAAATARNPLVPALGALAGLLVGARVRGGRPGTKGTDTGQEGEVGQVGRGFGPAPPTRQETEVVSGQNAISHMIDSGYPTVIDATGNRWVLEPHGAGFNGGYGTRTIIDVHGNPVTVVDPNQVAMTRVVDVPDVNLPTQIYSGQQAMNVLEQSGLVVRVPQPDGSFTWEPTPRFENLNGRGTVVRTAVSTDPLTGQIDGSQVAPIPRINGIGFGRVPPDDPNGTIDPNSLAIVVSQGPGGDRLGNAGAWNQVAHPQPGMQIEGDPAFVQQTQNHLNTIGGTPSGQQLLNGLQASGQDTMIAQVPPGSGNRHISDHPLDNFIDGGNPGAGSGGTVGFDPTTLAIGPDGPLAPWHNRPPDVGLFHELRHRLDGATGQMPLGQQPDPFLQALGINEPINNREAQATGIGTFAGTSPTENSYRAERGLDPRESYAF